MVAYALQWYVHDVLEASFVPLAASVVVALCTSHARFPCQRVSNPEGVVRASAQWNN